MYDSLIKELRQQNKLLLAASQLEDLYQKLYKSK